MKKTLLALAAIALSGSAAMAAPRYHYDHGSRVTPHERGAIARSAAHLAALKRKVWADGRLSMFERMELRRAERHHAAVIARAHRS